MIRTFSLIILTGTLSLMAATITVKPMGDREIQKIAREAKSPADHLEVARQHEIRAKAFETKAIRYEADADELAKRDGYNPMKHKWPAMVQAPIDRARANGMQARRAAKESLELMAKHQDLAAKAPAQAAE
jgi:hypothetical protein